MEEVLLASLTALAVVVMSRASLPGGLWKAIVGVGVVCCLLPLASRLGICGQGFVAGSLFMVALIISLCLVWV